MTPPTFYMLSVADQSWLRACESFQAVFSARLSQFAEVLAYDLLVSSPHRVFTPDNATLVYLPMWEWTSLRVGVCANTTHRERMSSLALTLRGNAVFLERQESTFWITSASQASARDTAVASERGDLRHRLYDVFGLLRHTVSGQRKTQRKLDSTAAGRQFTIPYATPPPDSTALARPRERKVFFGGSFDVCCTGRIQRCKLARFANDSTFLLRTLARSKPRVCGRDVPLCTHRCEELMRAHEVCLIPAGDTAVSARLYTAVSYGCIPVIMHTGDLAFSSNVDYSAFSVRTRANGARLAAEMRDLMRDDTRLACLRNGLAAAQRSLLWYGASIAPLVLEDARRLSRSAV